MASVRTINSDQMMSRSLSCSSREVTIQTFSPVVRAIKLTHYRTRSLVFNQVRYLTNATLDEHLHAVVVSRLMVTVNARSLPSSMNR